MSSWPWMQGIEEAIADPINPVCPEDDRPSVKELILKHSEKIAKIKAALEDFPLYEPNKHDDLWILRFWLSHKKSKSAIEAAKYTLEFREKHNLDDLDIRDQPPQHLEDCRLINYWNVWNKNGVQFCVPDSKRGVMNFIDVGGMDSNAAVENFAEDQWLAVYLYPAEYSFQCLDYVTRTTGRLTKSVRFADCRGLSLSGFNMECTRRDGRAMALMEDCYPQLLDSIFVCNAPTLVGAIWKIVGPIFPMRVRSKFDIINPKTNKKDRKKLLKHISEQDLPDFYGGKNPVNPRKWGIDDVVMDQPEVEMHWWNL